MSPEQREKQRQQKARKLKYEKIQGLEALLLTHENGINPDHDYCRELRARIRSARNQFNAMRGDLLE